jgi:hypothetical protein
LPARERVKEFLLGPEGGPGMTAQSALTSTLIFLVPMILFLIDGVAWALLLLIPSIFFAWKTVDAARRGHYGSLRGPRGHDHGPD